MMIPFFKPNVGVDESLAVADCLANGWLTSGQKMRDFEDAVKEYVGAQQVVALNSNTAGLHLVLLSLNLKADDEVIVPAITFAACAETVVSAGGKVVLCDINFNSRSATLDSIQRVYTTKTKAIVLVHFAGQPPDDYDQICDWAASFGVKIIEDAAHTFGAYYCGTSMRVGSSRKSYATVFSFYATKCITTGGEGGAVATSNPELADRLRVLRLHGISTDVFNRYAGKTSRWEYDVTEVGWKYNMTDLSAAIGLVQLEKADDMREARAHIAKRYMEGLDPNIHLQDMNKAAHCFHLFTIWVECDREELIKDMFASGVSCSVHFKPLNLLTAYSDLKPQQIAHQYWSGCLSLPLYVGMTEADIDHVIKVTNECYRNLMGI